MSYEEKKQRLMHAMAQAERGVELGKDTSNLFRALGDKKHTIDVRDFTDVLTVNTDEHWVECEGMATYEQLTDAVLAHGMVPAVVPELKSITIGGAISGTGLESSSFRYGFVHETVHEMDVLLADGRVVTCTPDNEHSDLFFGIPNAYGTLGYVLRVRAQTVPSLPYVHVTHTVYRDAATFFSAIRDACGDEHNDFVEGVVFAPDRYVRSTARFVSEAPYTSDYTYMRIYYKSLLKRGEDYLTARDYLWRWDTDWFWRSDLFFAQHPPVRLLLGRKRLNSVFYTKLMRWNRRRKFTDALAALNPWRRKTETVIQDVEIPIENAPAFLEFFHKEVGMRPIIIGPVVGSPTGSARFPLFPLDPNTLYVNIGFWGLAESDHADPHHLNKRIEQMVEELGGLKMLYSDSFYTREKFWQLYHGEREYRALKAKYDPSGKLGDLYDKCCRAARSAR